MVSIRYPQRLLRPSLDPCRQLPAASVPLPPAGRDALRRQRAALVPGPDTQRERGLMKVPLPFEALEVESGFSEYIVNIVN